MSNRRSTAPASGPMGPETSVAGASWARRFLLTGLFLLGLWALLAASADAARADPGRADPRGVDQVEPPPGQDGLLPGPDSPGVLPGVDVPGVVTEVIDVLPGDPPVEDGGPPPPADEPVGPPPAVVELPVVAVPVVVPSELPVAPVVEAVTDVVAPVVRADTGPATAVVQDDPDGDDSEPAAAEPDVDGSVPLEVPVVELVLLEAVTDPVTSTVLGSCGGAVLAVGEIARTTTAVPGTAKQFTTSHAVDRIDRAATAGIGPPVGPLAPTAPAQLPLPAAPAPACPSGAHTTAGSSGGPGHTEHADIPVAVLEAGSPASSVASAVRPTSGFAGAIAGGADDPGSRPD